MDSLIRSSVLAGFHSLATELGGHPAHLLQDCNLNADVALTDDQYLPLGATVALLERSAEELKCPDFALRLSTRQGLSMLGPLAVLARNARTVASAMQSMSEFMHLVIPALKIRLESLSTKPGLRIYIHIDEPGLFHTRQLHELVMGNGQEIIRMLIGGDDDEHALCMHFPHSPLATANTYAAFFGCPIHFQQSFCAVDLPLSIAQREVIGADDQTGRIAAEYLAQNYEVQRNKIEDKVSHLIRRLLPTGYCKLPVIAKQLHIHPKTLQRHLLKSGKVFDAMVDGERQALLQRYLTQPELPLSQITGLLGYADQSGLNRSCRRWFNKTPKQLRREMLAGEAQSSWS